MKKIVPLCASLAFLLAAPGGAKAGVITDFGTITVPDSVGSANAPPASTSFSDQYLFRVNTDASVIELSSVLNNLPGGAEIDLTTFVVRLYESFTSGAAVKDSLLATAVQRAAPNDDIFDLTFSPVIAAAGAPPLPQYFIDADGDCLSTVDCSYSVLLTVSAVPLPPAAVLFLSALAGLVGFSRIRRRRVVPERRL